VPVGNILVGNARGDIEHNDTTLSVNIVTITEASKFLLSCSIPDIELNVTQVLCDISNRRQTGIGTRRTYRAEPEGMNLNTESCNILLLEFTSQMTLDEGGLPMY
jgi:hypothetical protein